MEETIEFTEEILEILKTEGYNFMLCTPLNMKSSSNAADNDKALAILFTPILKVIDGFKLLSDLNDESFILSLEEVEDEIYLTRESHLKFYINRESLLVH